MPDDSGRIVMLGVGHTHALVLKRLASEPIAGVHLTCISDHPIATYSGMLPGTLAGQFDPDEMQIDLATLCRGANADLIRSKAIGLNRSRREVLFESRQSVPFDVLSIDVGSVPVGQGAVMGQPSVVSIKPMQTFLPRLYERLAKLAKESSPIRIAIVGGGVAGVELALCLHALVSTHFSSPSSGSVEAEERGFGEGTELRRTLSSLIRLPSPRRRKLLRDPPGGRVKSAPPILLFTAGDWLCPELNDSSREKLSGLLQRRGIIVHTNHRVTDVERSAIRCQDGGRHRADVVLWATGPAPPPLISQLGLATTHDGFLATAPTLQSLSDQRIFGVGDCATIESSPSPKAGVYAVRQATTLFQNLRAAQHGTELSTSADISRLNRVPSGPRVAGQCPDGLTERNLSTRLESFTPQTDFLKILNTGDGRALLQYGRFNAHARWCWWLKNWIDRRFVRQFRR